MEGRMKEYEEEEEVFYSPEHMEATDEENGVICSNECNNKEQKKKIDHLRAIVEKQDPACKDVDDFTLGRFLLARDLDVEKASAMFMKYVKWRRMFVPKGLILESEITKQIAHNKVFMQGTDRKGRPIAIIFGARHVPCNENIDQLKRFAVFVFDKLSSRTPHGEGKFTILADLKGYGYSNNDVRGFIPILSILQNYYPERLGKLLFIHVPYIFLTAWKIINPFIDKNTKKKIVFVENKRVEATLLEEIYESQLPEMYGGKLHLVPIQDA
ncbi:random slug protein 5 [Phtheirospermum japonicum]|uniref:Random slug protein 5 n=1 Tax=Phtheirospermum japonicum TaxID=374723 RepID=A0A830D1Z2_9LAMI|nr:random slug protein 5 [Phtheirospermum japonicum]